MLLNHLTLHLRKSDFKKILLIEAQPCHKTETPGKSHVRGKECQSGGKGLTEAALGLILVNILIDDLEGGSNEHVNSVPGRKLIGRQGRAKTEGWRGQIVRAVMGLGWMAEEAEAEAGLSGKGIQRGSRA